MFLYFHSYHILLSFLPLPTSYSSSLPITSPSVDAHTLSSSHAVTGLLSFIGCSIVAEWHSLECLGASHHRGSVGKDAHLVPTVYGSRVKRKSYCKLCPNLNTCQFITASYTEELKIVPTSADNSFQCCLFMACSLSQTI